MKKKTLIITISAGIVGALALVVAIPFTILGIRTVSIKTDHAYLKDDPTYSQKANVVGVELVKQHVSCGYATIEMLSSFYGEKVSEDDLDARNKHGVSTSSSDGFLNEINKSIPNKNFEAHKYLNNDVLLKEIHSSLKNGNPVALEWAALYEEEWTLHFSVVTGLDIANDNVTVNNPYGYIENITVDEFINRTTFEAYKSIPLFLNFGFAFGAFDKNTIFYFK